MPWRESKKEWISSFRSDPYFRNRRGKWRHKDLHDLGHRDAHAMTGRSSGKTAGVRYLSVYSDYNSARLLFVDREAPLFSWPPPDRAKYRFRCDIGSSGEPEHLVGRSCNKLFQIGDPSFARRGNQ